MAHDLARDVRRIVAIGGALIFVGSLLYFAWCYLWRFGQQPSTSGGTSPAILADLALFTAFAVHHSVFARTPLKNWMRRQIPPDLERSVYVWIASLIFIATCAFWQPVPGTLWNVESSAARAVLSLIQIAAAVFTVVAARRLGVLELAGVTQVTEGEPRAVPTLDDRGPYRIVRHPIYLGWVLLVWATPTMTGTRLVFAAISSLYLLLAVPFEERDLERTFGAAYADYGRRVRWRVLPFIY